jgi:hypothetical protein
VTRTSGPLSATLTASPHTPKINVPMSIKVTATLDGRPAQATLIYQYLYGGAVVSTRYPCNNRACRFTGHCSDNLTFPATSLGMPPTLQVVVKAAGHTVKLDSAITAHGWALQSVPTSASSTRSVTTVGSTRCATRSGSGRSTLLNMIGGLEQPSTGQRVRDPIA